MNQLVETFCFCCKWIGDLEERGYCPNCGQGPAAPSAERVWLGSGKAVPLVLGIYSKQDIIAKSRPAFQQICASGSPARTEDELRSRQAAEAQHRLGARPSPATSRGFTARQVREAVVRVRRDKDGQPTREEVAMDLHVSVSTLGRIMRDLQMGPWPPQSEDDRS